MQIKMLLITYHMGGHLMIASNVLSWCQALWNGFTTLFAFSSEQRCLILELYMHPNTPFTQTSPLLQILWIDFPLIQCNHTMNFSNQQVQFTKAFQHVNKQQSIMWCFVPSRKTQKEQYSTQYCMNINENIRLIICIWMCTTKHSADTTRLYCYSQCLVHSVFIVILFLFHLLVSPHLTLINSHQGSKPTIKTTRQHT